MLLRNAGDFWQPVKLTLDFLSQGFGGDTKPRKKRGFWARLFGVGKGKEKDEKSQQNATPKKRPGE